MKSLLIFTAILFNGLELLAQSCFPDKENTSITLTCSENCTDLRFTIPDLKQTTSYKVLDIPYAPLPFIDPRASAITFSGAWPGNSYSAIQDLGFDFCFFGDTYNQLAIGSNGTVTFDVSAANGWCDPYLLRGPASFPLPNTRYPGALIAAVMHDLDPGDTGRVSSGRKIEMRIEGDAPCRKAIINFYQVPLWPSPSRICHLAGTNTHQVILYESTGIIDVFVKDSPQCNGSNGGYNTLAIQNLARTEAFSPRNKNCTQWGGSNLNLGYRFLPSGGTSTLLSTQLLVNGRNVGSGTVNPGAVDGELIVSFPSICPTAANNLCVLRAVYATCTGVGTIELLDTIHISKTNSLQATATSAAAICTSPTGSIRVSVPTGVGVAPITYSINRNPPQASPTFSNLIPGTYEVVVLDASICTDTIIIEVESLSTLNVSLDVTNPSCNRSSDGSITVDAGGGVAPLQYSINGNPPQASPVFNNLAPGVYTITVVDDAGCISNNNRATVLPGPRLITTATKTDISCFGNTDGTISVDPPLNGTAPFEYSIDGINYRATNFFTGLAAGAYTIRFRDAGGCDGEVTAFIFQPAELQGSAVSTAVRCNSQSNGTITITANGGSGPYRYSLDGSSFQTSNIFNVPAGTYTVYIRDRVGCRVSFGNITVNEPAAITGSASIEPALCDEQGVITLSAAGGVPGYEFSMDGINFQAGAVFSVEPGTYNSSIKDLNGCIISVPAIVVPLINTLTISKMADETLCEGKSVQLEMISNARSYTWTPATGLSNAAISNPVASPSGTTEYTVRATLGRCEAEDTLLVNIIPAPIANAGPDGDICVGQNFRLQGSGSLNYEWSPATYLDNPAIASPLSTPDQTIDYSLKVTDANGCVSLNPDIVRVIVTPPIKVIANPVDTIAYTGDQFQLRAQAPASSYLWTPSAGLSDATVADPIVTAGAVGDVQLYKVVATTSAGCTGEAFVKIRVYKGPDLYVPGAFTPNNDGKNDRFYPIPVGVASLNYFRVFDRWGRMVFSTSTLGHGWDGKLGGMEASSAVYTWLVQGQGRDGKIIQKKGTVVLIR